MDNRYQNLCTWLKSQYAEDCNLTSLQKDASTRQYYRFTHQQQKLLAVDSLPAHENNDGYLYFNQLLSQHNVKVPKIYEQDLKQGFFIVEDCGDDLYLKLLNPQNAEQLYTKAFQALLKFTKVAKTPKLHDYTAQQLLREMQFFARFKLQQHDNLKLTAKIERSLHKVYNILLENALAQPTIFVHRDFHARNLLLHNDALVVIDYQDAQWGPLTYDLISLLRDCYINWPHEQVIKWQCDYLKLLKEHKVVSTTLSSEQFIRWCDLMTLQRNLKTSGQFISFAANNNHAYLPHVPRVLAYAQYICETYPELASFVDFLTYSDARIT